MSTGAPISVIALLTMLCVILLVIGLVLHRKGVLQSRAAALAWAVLTILPLFAGGWVIFTHR